jgi:aldehyde dehydrogenase (NAD+)
VHRKPFGVVLIVGPSNYPLFIPAVQMLHALVAGNAVLIKPAPDSTQPLAYFLEHVLSRSGIPCDLVQLLPETVEAAHDAVRCGIDKAIFTGSSANGRDFLGHLAHQNTPSIMELSGADAVFVRSDADVELTAKAIAFGASLNGGNTCMAPHAILVHVSCGTGALAGADQVRFARHETARRPGRRAGVAAC